MHLVFISAEEVMFLSVLVSWFVCYQDYAKTLNRFSQTSVERWRPWRMGNGKKSLDFGGNPDRVTLDLELG